MAHPCRMSGREGVSRIWFHSLRNKYQQVLQNLIRPPLPEIDASTRFEQTAGRKFLCSNNIFTQLGQTSEAS